MLQHDARLEELRPVTTGSPVTGELEADMDSPWSPHLGLGLRLSLAFPQVITNP